MNMKKVEVSRIFIFIIKKYYSDIDPYHVACLIDKNLYCDESVFTDGKINYRPLLSQIVSSELDADRMDYLERDSYFCGITYGNIDRDWLVQNLTVHIHDYKANLALNRRALYAFDDFLISPKISKLNPTRDSKFIYNTVRWAKLNKKHKVLISDFQNKEISRADIIKAFKNYYDRKGEPMRAFLLTMVWGFADTGYGTHRTNSYISIPSNVKLIKKAIDFVSNHDLKSAYNCLNKIKGLGVSYITKVLYFASRGANQSNYALIYDIRVATALVKLTTPKEIVDIIRVSPSANFDDYQKYNILIHDVAHKYNIEAESIEIFLFNQNFT